MKGIGAHKASPEFFEIWGIGEKSGKFVSERHLELHPQLQISPKKLPCSKLSGSYPLIFRGFDVPMVRTSGWNMSGKLQRSSEIEEVLDFAG